ncbi:hypothetical protein ONS96_009566 [Cadophora gregata f. sp. sojae]|nr:hypothetical protein ONS96_008375 [Cadophora gregata f. sp. sojae]KAK0112575.1 hypothetical protein ONS96_001810 [Cadophora gregata f. sp. sojae]KAK0125735.1 hypothetical protein ONS96_009566 [Cadophora gregata f. sp. sojae]
MADIEVSTKSISLIHNTDLPRPLNVLSTAIAEFSKQDYIAWRVPEYEIHIIDIASYNFSQADSPSGLKASESNTTPLKSPSDWQAEISKHSAFILLFPYHTWSHCTSLKHALSILPPHLIHKPTLLLGFGKEEPYHPNEYERTWKKKSFGMMRDFLLEKAVKLVKMENDSPQGGWPEFMVYADYWEDWTTGGYNAFIGGQ